MKTTCNSTAGSAIVIIAMLALVTGCSPRAGEDENSTSADAPEQRVADGDGTPKTDEGSGGVLADPIKQSLWIVKSQDGIKARLKDPGSAEFRNVHFYSGSGKPVVCGEVNAKNGFGGYTGFEHFVASGEDLAILASDMASPNEMAIAWNELCVRAPSDKN